MSTRGRRFYACCGLKSYEESSRDEFFAGTNTMYLGSTANLTGMIAGVGDKFELGVGYLPSVTAQDDGGVTVGGSALFVFNKQDDAKVQAAWSFMKYMASPEVQLDWHQSTGYFPVNKGSYDLPGFAQHIQANPLYQVAIDQPHDSNPQVQGPWVPASYKFSGYITEALTAYIEGKIDVDAAIAQMTEACNTLISDYNQANPS